MAFVLKLLSVLHLARSNQIKDLVLLGDVFDNWVCPAEQVPPSYDEIMSANLEELDRLEQAVKKGINVFYIHGNHDYDLPKALLENQVPGLQVIAAYKSGRTHAEHGHLHTLFNNPDYLNDPGYGRPLGYYISRLYASSGHAMSFSDIVSTLDDVIGSCFNSVHIDRVIN
ncbi:MAG: hypothetical protein CL608_22315 [Anaerolineaceae bacterium]|nr:hypothetical protein [Anaerolineaceae bacterium]